MQQIQQQRKVVKNAGVKFSDQDNDEPGDVGMNSTGQFDKEFYGSKTADKYKGCRNPSQHIPSLNNTKSS